MILSRNTLFGVASRIQKNGLPPPNYGVGGYFYGRRDPNYGKKDPPYGKRDPNYGRREYNCFRCPAKYPDFVALKARLLPCLCSANRKNYIKYFTTFAT
ncbi:MAG: hypothetical protein LBU22_10680 [Dysgonamonadaceae bacterium]|nr:hypothetical protein [Dysgonamonadaceae bacterium]